MADVGILLPTPPEMIAGSTRMGAGTAQKIALNMMSTLVAIHLGHVHDGYMVNLHADNMKLRGRAARIVAAIAGCGRDEAALLAREDRRLGQAGDAACRRRRRRGRAQERLLDGAGQKLRPALVQTRGAGARSSRHNANLNGSKQGD